MNSLSDTRKAMTADIEYQAYISEETEYDLPYWSLKMCKSVQGDREYIAVEVGRYNSREEAVVAAQQRRPGCRIVE